MHLKLLKLSGFKSFVDSTIVHFPSQLVAVVGPNGCGKSNIIDAVRWVMGESSAKNLRGESMVDVIFNGSSNRKSLGQASVELIFDNSLGRLTGPFASYGEIAVKRSVTRDGESSYYLNGNRCRRKDITDIFLGTGSGARGYSIIGQGTISRMIEAKPEDLRVFLEEAAGVSKYKERRRETVQRIEHTRENLTRVADIREELEKQLQRLERQAKAAERYTLLKEEEKRCKAEILALKWRELLAQQEKKQLDLQQHILTQEQQQSVLTHTLKEKTRLNEAMHEASEQSQKIQHDFYQLNTEIARLEETIQQQEKEKNRLEQDKQRLQTDSQNADERLKQDKEALLECEQSAQRLQTHLLQLKAAFKKQEEQWQNSKKQDLEWESGWQKFQQEVLVLKNEIQVIDINQQHLIQRRQQTQVRLEKIDAEQAAISLTDLEHLNHELEKKHIKLKETQQFDDRQFKECNEQLTKGRMQLQDLEIQIHQLQDTFHVQNSEYAALIAAQKAAKQSGQNSSHHLSSWSNKDRLVDVLKVESQWQSVCEMILGDTLQAYVLDDFDEIWPQWRSDHTGLSAVTMKMPTREKLKTSRLIDKIQGAIPLSKHNLETIYIAEHLDAAKNLLPELSEQESIVTQQGFWLGKGWIKLANCENHNEPGLIARQQKIEDLAQVVKALEEKMTSFKVKRDDCTIQLQERLRDIELYRMNLDASNEALRANEALRVSNAQKLDHANRLIATSALERSELLELLEEMQEQFLKLENQSRDLKEKYQCAEKQLAQCVSEKQVWAQDLAQKGQYLDALRQQLHRAEMEYDRDVTKIQQINDRILREQERLDLLQERLEQLALFYMQAIDPTVDLRVKLAQQLAMHRNVESQLSKSREQLSEMKKESEAFEKEFLNYDLSIKKLQETISQIKMEEQAYSVRAHSVYESLEETGFQALSVLETIPEGTSQHAREEALITITEKIKRLGAINLAAIEEFTLEQERKQYLDKQYDDLNQALSTLETAIEKMDKETHLRLENTFEEVNTSFKALFPRLFGGGRAQLEWTCENLLEAGIVVMAQPPGKRNSTIHLLSGGEKAMTAVALVFAIFQLNPSPFCMLDEVDAPLDDVNVTRFCALVKEMSQFVQFLFITHNKITMELADHLIGVTMREPGVSRLVAVDVKQALTME